jgi:methionyl-tRNA formyltransferase
MMEELRIIFMGTPGFAVPSLDALLKEGFNVVAVITAPDRPSGRGLKMKPSPVKSFADAHGIPVLQPTNLKDPGFIEELKSFGANLQIVVAFRMLPEIVWAMPEHGTFNLHASLLPRYRGAAPINHAIINGEPETGVTTFFLSKEIDTGNIIFREKTSIGPDETFGELHDRLKHLGAGLVTTTAKAIKEGTVSEIPQQDLFEEGTELRKAPKIYREDCRIDWKSGLNSIHNKIRGLSPYPAAYTKIIDPAGKEIQLKIYRADKKGKPGSLNHPEIFTDGKTYLSILVDGGEILLREVQLAGKKRMEVEEFLRGFQITNEWKIS